MIMIHTRRALLAGACVSLSLVLSLGSPAPRAPARAARARGSVTGLTIRLSAFDRAGTRVVPARIAAGYVPLTVINDLPVPAGVFFARVSKGYTTKQAISIADNPQSPPAAASRAATWVGGLQTDPPARTATGWLRLTPGRYFVTLGAQSRQATQSFTVEPAASAAQGEPASTATVFMRENAFALPAVLPAGAITLKLVNSDTDIHLALIARVPATATAKQMAHDLTLPPARQPAWMHRISAVGTAPLSPRQTTWMTLQVTPGHYAILCPLPDAKGIPHFLMGMLAIVQVR